MRQEFGAIVCFLEPFLIRLFWGFLISILPIQKLSTPKIFNSLVTIVVGAGLKPVPTRTLGIYEPWVYPVSMKNAGLILPIQKLSTPKIFNLLVTVVVGAGFKPAPTEIVEIYEPWPYPKLIKSTGSISPIQKLSTLKLID